MATIKGTSCPGIGSTRAQYATGRLVIYSCKKGGKTLSPALDAPTCAEPVEGFFTESGTTTAPSTMAEVWSDVIAHTSKTHGGTARTSVGGYLAIADPKNGWNFANTGCGPSDVAPNAPYGLAGMEALYVAAVEYYHAHPRPCVWCQRRQSGVHGDRLDDRQGIQLGQLRHHEYLIGWSERQRQLLRSLASDHLRRQRHLHPGHVVAGTSQIALLPKSFVISPGGNDTDFWAEVPECGVASVADASVTNGWSAHISSEETCTDRNYVAGIDDNVASTISSRNFGKNGEQSPRTLIGQHGFYQPIRQWVVVENDEQGQDAATDLSSPDGIAALAFIKYLISAKGQAVLASFGYNPIS